MSLKSIAVDEVSNAEVVGKMLGGINFLQLHTTYPALVNMISKPIQFIIEQLPWQQSFMETSRLHEQDPASSPRSICHHVMAVTKDSISRLQAKVKIRNLTSQELVIVAQYLYYRH